MPISNKLKEILKERDLSQLELARMTGLRPNTISHLCSGQCGQGLSIDIRNSMQSVRHRHSGVNRGGLASCSSNRSMYVKVAKKFKRQGENKRYSIGEYKWW